MKTVKRRRKLLLQIALITIPVFLLMLCAVAQTIYISSVNSYLKAQEKQIADMMNGSEIYIPLKNNAIYKDDSDRKQIFDDMEMFPIDDRGKLTDDEVEAVLPYLTDQDLFGTGQFDEIPESIRNMIIQELLWGAKDKFESTTMSGSFENLFYISAANKERIRVLIDFKLKNSESDKGKYFDIDLSQHTVLRDLFESGSKEMVFERTSSFPIEGNLYICYFPVMINDSLYSVVGLAYDWDDLRQSVINTIINTIVIINIGMTVMMVMIMLHLYYRAIRPAARIQDALRGYAADNNTPGIVNKMYDIKANNELGYLADTIADLSLEIEHYNNENIRIAVAKERTERELYEAKVAVMTSQIRPHFMYNALTSIAMMCDIDPKTAKQATITFAKYLRGNMDSLKQTTPVPFKKELEHLQNYLYIEKLRFDDLLNIEYDIQATDFEVPLLSIQPLVENAVKHGVGMKDDGGTVTIATKETDGAYEVIISDDGVGYDTTAEKKDDGRSHVGMENTKKRLKDMCGADITITSEVGVGTTVTVTIPKKEETNEDTVS
ncbi:MAG: histidine kinase [Ruminiclostridium sp.]|nr:histidine kinase [Ruminiclostridium sp.]